MLPLVNDATVAAYVADAEVDGELHLVSGAVRASVRGDVVTLADDSLTSTLAVAVRSAHGFVFLSRDGVAATSQTFTGKLRSLGELPYGLAASARSIGRLAVVDERHRLWATDGSTPLAEVPVPFPIVGAAFTDAQHGAVIRDGGQLFVTADAGAHFLPVDLHGEVALDLVVTAMGYAISSSTEWLEITAGGTVAGPISAPSPADEATPAQWQAVHRALWRHNLLAPPPGRMVRLDDGRAFWADAHDLVAMAADGTATVRPLATAVPEQVWGLYAWGNALAAVCVSSNKKQADWQLYRSADGQAFSKLPRGPLTTDGLVFSDDGRFAAWPRSCHVTAANFSPGQGFTTACVYDNKDHQVRNVSLGATPAAALYGMHGAQLLYGTHGSEHVHPGVFLLDVSLSAPPRPLGSALPASRPLSIATAGIAVDGAVAVLLQDGDFRQLWMGTPELGLRHFPPAAQAVAFVDATHGVAVGKNLAEVFRTTDGAAHWEAVPIPILGSPQNLVYPPVVVCDAGQCMVDGVLRVPTRGALAAGEKTALARTRSVLAAPAVALFQPPAQVVRCVADAARRETSEVVEPPAGTRRLRLDGGGARAALLLGHQKDGSETLAVRWSAFDGRGAFRGAMPEAVLPAPEVPADASAPPGFIADPPAGAGAVCWGGRTRGGRARRHAHAVLSSGARLCRRAAGRAHRPRQRADDAVQDDDAG